MARFWGVDYNTLLCACQLCTLLTYVGLSRLLPLCAVPGCSWALQIADVLLGRKDVTTCDWFD